jgi:hypothetical protein
MSSGKGECAGPFMMRRKYEGDISNPQLSVGLLSDLPVVLSRTRMSVIIGRSPGSCFQQSSMSSHRVSVNPQVVQAELVTGGRDGRRPELTRIVTAESRRNS